MEDCIPLARIRHPENTSDSETLFKQSSLLRCLAAQCTCGQSHAIFREAPNITVPRTKSLPLSALTPPNRDLSVQIETHVDLLASLHMLCQYLRHN
eukprot:1683187-Amphidinium_carterae.2